MGHFASPLRTLVGKLSRCRERLGQVDQRTGSKPIFDPGGTRPHSLIEPFAVTQLPAIGWDVADVWVLSWIRIFEICLFNSVRKKALAASLLP
jgi:hypothetical protein